MSVMHHRSSSFPSPGGVVAADVRLSVPHHGFFVASNNGVSKPGSHRSAGLRFDTMDDDEDPSSPCSTTRELIGKESADLFEFEKRLSVRDLASKFESGQVEALDAVEKLSEDVRFRETASLDQQALLQKLRNVLDDLSGRVTGLNKEDAVEALLAVDALSSQLSQREEELAQEKMEVRKLAALFKQASEDAKRMVEEARSIAYSEIESARAAVRRIEQSLEQSLDQRDKISGVLSQQELEEMRREVQEARRIKMLHESSKAMDMEHELEGLRQQLVQKSNEASALRKELEVLRSPNGEKSNAFRLEGVEALGSCLQVVALDDHTVEVSQCNFQWHRISADKNKTELISGATKSQYAPEPFDVGRYLRVDVIMPNGQKSSASSSGVIDPAPGLGNYVEALVRKGGAEFQVIVVQQNGEVLSKQSVHGFNIGRVRIKLRKGRTTKAKEPYSAAMQLCGARGAGPAAAQALYWHAKKGLSFLLCFESARERNAAIMLARRFSFDCNIMLAGPDDRAPLGT